MPSNTKEAGKTREVPGRVRKAHKKSRRGCRNCKLRRVKESHSRVSELPLLTLHKCDETQPDCVQCSSFGVTCNYNPSIPDLQMIHRGIVTINRKVGLNQQPNVVEKISSPGQLPLLRPLLLPSPQTIFRGYGLDPESSERLWRFQNRTSLSVSSPTGASIFQKVATDFALQASLLFP